MENSKRDWRVYIPLTIVIIAVAVGGVMWYADYSRYVKTDDAYVTSDNVAVSSKILGRVVHIYAKEGDTVKSGQLLAVLDTTDLVAQRDQAIAAKREALASGVQADAKLSYDKKSIRVQEISLQKAKDDLKRATIQYDGGVITKELYDKISKDCEIASAQLEAAKSQLKVSEAQLLTTESRVGTANAQINLVSTQIGNCKLYSPTDGVVAKRWLLPGDITSPGQSLFTINNNTKFWIQVYLEETKMESVHPGSNSIYTIDMYPGYTFYGKVFTVGSTTASQFSLIPPSNASGNFTKVTQRVPVKISIDGIKEGGDLSKFRLLTGMSAVVKIER